MSKFAEERSRMSENSTRYGKNIIDNFDINEDLVTWEVDNPIDYEVDITHPEVSALCPVSGYPDSGEVQVKYVPNKKTVELKAFKLWVNSYRNKAISHENLLKEIFTILKEKLEPKKLWVQLRMQPRGNVRTIVTANFEKKEINYDNN